MLVLMCHAGTSRYAIDSARVVEVTPSVHFDPVAESPEWIAGVFTHRGRATPLVDLTQLLTGRPCARRWNSRIILARFDVDELPLQLGLLAERVTTAEIDTQATATPTEASSAMERLGPILIDGQGMFQLVDLARLLSADRRAAIRRNLSEGTS